MTALYTRMTILGAAATFALTGAAWASTATKPLPVKPMAMHVSAFTALDTNHDGAITQDELKSDVMHKDAKVSHAARTVSGQFATLDADHNNSLSEAEFAKGSWTSPTKAAMKSTAKKIKTASAASDKPALVKASAKASETTAAVKPAH